MRGKYTEASGRAQRKYDDANTWHFAIKLNHNTDTEVIEHLQGIKAHGGSMSLYVINLIRADIGLDAKEPLTRKLS